MQRDLASRASSEQLEADLGDTLNALGQVLLHSGDSAKALTALEQAQSQRRKLSGSHAGNIEFQRKLANTTMNIGLVYKSLNRLADAVKSLDDAQTARREALANRSIESAGAQELLLWRDVALGYYNRANLALAMKDISMAGKELEQAIAVLEHIEVAVPNDLRNRERLAACYHLAARLGQEVGNDSEAARGYARAIAALEVLHRFSPQVVEFQERLAVVQMDHGAQLARQGDQKAALLAYANACEHLEKIVPEPDTAGQPERRRNYAVALRERARAHVEVGQPAGAEELLAKSQTYLEQLIARSSADASRRPLEDDLKQTKRLQNTLKAAREGN
jgi:tetratricopeptide (TPR) repeat protein